LTLFHKSGSLDVAVWQQLREENQPPYVDRDLEDLPRRRRVEWPKLAPAGREPDHELDEITHRTHM
jgi:hypothetical protein